jgi:hypothetical protein
MFVVLQEQHALAESLANSRESELKELKVGGCCQWAIVCLKHTIIGTLLQMHGHAGRCCQQRAASDHYTHGQHCGCQHWQGGGGSMLAMHNSLLAPHVKCPVRNLP